MSYAVIVTGGKQYKVNPGTILEVERLKNVAAGTISFDQVLLVVDRETISIGKPTVAGAVVTAKVLADIKGDKIRVAKFRAKSRHRRVMGHRQSLSRIQIEEITVAGKKMAAKTAPIAKKEI